VVAFSVVISSGTALGSGSDDTGTVWALLVSPQRFGSILSLTDVCKVVRLPVDPGRAVTCGTGEEAVGNIEEVVFRVVVSSGTALGSGSVIELSGMAVTVDPCCSGVVCLPTTVLA
jgi:hypothetical protein